MIGEPGDRCADCGHRRDEHTPDAEGCQVGWDNRQSADEVGCRCHPWWEPETDEVARLGPDEPEWRRVLLLALVELENARDLALGSTRWRPNAGRWHWSPDGDGARLLARIEKALGCVECGAREHTNACSVPCSTGTCRHQPCARERVAAKRAARRQDAG